MLGQSVESLERKMDCVEAILTRLEPRISEIASELRHIPRAGDLTAVRTDVAEIKGRVAGIEARLSSFPTTVQLVSLMITTWAAGAAIVFTIVRLAR